MADSDDELLYLHAHCTWKMSFPVCVDGGGGWGGGEYTLNACSALSADVYIHPYV